MPDADEFLTIETVLKDQDRIEPPAAFLLATVKGTEGMSFPYAYDVTLLRKTSRRDLEPRELIGTPCSISIRRKRTSKEEKEDAQEPEFNFTVRHGVFEHLSRVAGAWKSEFRVYVGRIVPAFTLLARESRHRIFEDADVTSILKRSLEGAPHLILDTEMLELEKFPVLDYCVQFGETTFAFVSRLMARYGIWYYFDHEGLDPATGKPRGRETLVLGRSFTGKITPARHPKVIVIGDKKPDDAGVVCNFVRRYDPSGRRVDVGNFNPLNPTAPFTGAAAANEEYAAQVVNAPAAQRFEDVAFPEPVLSDQEAEDDAKQLMRREESAVYSVTGLSREVCFRAGRIFIVTQDLTAPGDVLDVPTRRIFGGQDPKYVVTFLSFVASEIHGRTVASTFLELFTMLHQNLVSNLGLGDDGDLTLGIVNDMLNNYLVDMQEVAWRNAFNIGPSSERERCCSPRPRSPAAGGRWPRSCSRPS